MKTMSTRTLTYARASHVPLREEADGILGQGLARRVSHYSVMTEEVVRFLDVQKGEVVVDATYGVGGHSAAIKKTAKVTLIGFDADPASARDGVLTANFADMDKVLRGVGVTEVHKVLFDLGWNRGQLAAGRGFSFLTDEPLNMSYSHEPRSGFTAGDILNTFSEKALADIFFGYGEERYAKRIARAVVARREVRPYATTLELVETIRDAVPAPYRHLKLHFATRSFQALRIAVNDELTVLEQGLRAAWSLLAPEGRMVVITFHSIEDRIVKNLFREFARGHQVSTERTPGVHGELLLKKPLVPTQKEVRENPASRSAKLRAIKKNSN